MKTKSNNFWLDDDAEWKALQQRTANKPKTTPKAQQLRAVAANKTAQLSNKLTEPKKVEVSVNLALPTLRLPKIPKLSRSIRKKALIGLPILAVTLISSSLVYQILKKDPVPQTGVLAAAVKEPEFKTVLPSGARSATNDGKLGYDGAKKVASFTDKIGDVSITVSQQPLPEAFKKDTDAQVKKLAEGFSAKQVIASSSPTAYLGTSEKGPQTVIFAKKDVLVFITSESQIETDLWAEYITLLQ